RAAEHIAGEREAEQRKYDAAELPPDADLRSLQKHGIHMVDNHENGRDQLHCIKRGSAENIDAAQKFPAIRRFRRLPSLDLRAIGCLDHRVFVTKVPCCRKIIPCPLKGASKWGRG